jgi:hypothetical protein
MHHLPPNLISIPSEYLRVIEEVLEMGMITDSLLYLGFLII